MVLKLPEDLVYVVNFGLSILEENLALSVKGNAIQKHPGHKKGEAKSEAPVNVKITSESTGD